MNDNIIHVGVGEKVDLTEVVHIEIIGSSENYTSYIVKYKDSSRTNDEILLKPTIVENYTLAQLRKLACKIDIGTGTWRARARKDQLIPLILGLQEPVSTPPSLPKLNHKELLMGTEKKIPEPPRHNLLSEFNMTEADGLDTVINMLGKIVSVVDSRISKACEGIKQHDECKQRYADLGQHYHDAIKSVTDQCDDDLSVFVHTEAVLEGFMRQLASIALTLMRIDVAHKIEISDAMEEAKYTTKQ